MCGLRDIVTLFVFLVVESMDESFDWTKQQKQAWCPVNQILSFERLIPFWHFIAPQYQCYQMIEAKMHRFNFSKSITECKIYKPNAVSQPLSTDSWSRTNGASLIWKQIHFRNHIRICISVKIWISVDGTTTIAIFKFSMENNNCSLIYAMKKLSDCYHSVIWKKKKWSENKN